MSKNETKKAIIKKDKKDGTSEIIITQSPSKSLIGRIVIGILAFSMIAGVVAGLVIVMLQAAGVLK